MRELRRHPLRIMLLTVWVLGCFSLKAIGLTRLTGFLFNASQPSDWQMAVVSVLLLAPIVAVITWIVWAGGFQRIPTRAKYRPDVPKFDDEARVRSIRTPKER